MMMVMMAIRWRFDGDSMVIRWRFEGGDADDVNGDDCDDGDDDTVMMMMPTQVKERWCNYLDPIVRKDSFTQEEGADLFDVLLHTHMFRTRLVRFSLVHVCVFARACACCLYGY
jgi:hypothetical protein